MVKIDIKLDNKIYYLLVLVLVVIILNGVVYAFNSGFSGGDASVMGHSSDEVMINIGGTPKTLQAAIDGGDFGGGGGGTIDYSDCETKATCMHDSPGCEGTLFSCSTGYIMVGFYGGRGHSSAVNADDKFYCCKLVSS